MQQQGPTPARRRPGALTAVAVLLFIRGGFSLLGGLIALTGGTVMAAFGGGTLTVWGILFLAIGAVEIWAGIGILNLRQRARIASLVIVGVDALFTLIALFSGAPSLVIGLLIDGYVLWTLYSNESAFTNR